MLSPYELDFARNPYRTTESLADKKKRELEQKHQEKLASFGDLPIKKIMTQIVNIECWA